MGFTKPCHQNDVGRKATRVLHMPRRLIQISQGVIARNQVPEQVDLSFRRCLDLLVVWYHTDVSTVDMLSPNESRRPREHIDEENLKYHVLSWP